jgi:ABC-2 type transport system ATP-binding protein
MSIENKTAIKVTHLYKSFKLPHEKNTSVKSLIINPFKKRSFEKQEVLKDVSFDIKNGEFFGIVGRNGSGKSTLLKLLAGIYSPDKGTIGINGKLTPFIELGVGFNPELTGRENVFLNGALLGFSRKEMLVMYDEIVEFAEIEKFMDQKLKNYSSGMQVRLAFSIAIRAKSDILLIDEVLAVGDSAFQRKCYEVFNELRKNKRTIVFVTHDMSAVERFCDKVAVVDKGKLLGVYKPKDASLRYDQLNINEETNKQKTNVDFKKTQKMGKRRSYCRYRCL